MAMDGFEYHPNNHPYSPDNTPISPTILRFNRKSQQQAKGAALRTVYTQLTQAQILIAHSRSREPLSDEELVNPLPSPSQRPRMAADRRRPKPMDLNSRKKAEVDTQAQELSAARRARIASMPPKVDRHRAAYQRGQHPFMLGSTQRSRPAVDIESGLGPISRLDRYLRFWNTLRRREKVLMGILFLFCILAAAGLLGLIMYVKRPRSH